MASNNQIIIPDLPRNPKVINQDGTFTSEWKVFFDQFLQALQLTLTPEGIRIVQQTTDNIDLLTTSSSLGKILYDTTTNTFVGNIETSPGTYEWKTFTTS